LDDKEIIDKIKTVINEKIRVKFGGKQGSKQDDFFNIKVEISFKEPIEMSFYESLDCLILGIIKEDDFLDWEKTDEAETYFYNSFIALPEFDSEGFDLLEQDLKYLLLSAVSQVVAENFKQSKVYKLMVLYDDELKKRLEAKKII
jgi:hypothetical protein